MCENCDAKYFSRIFSGWIQNECRTYQNNVLMFDIPMTDSIFALIFGLTKSDCQMTYWGYVFISFAESIDIIQFLQKMLNVPKITFQITNLLRPGSFAKVFTSGKLKTSNQNEFQTFKIDKNISRLKRSIVFEWSGSVRTTIAAKG